MKDLLKVSGRDNRLRYFCINIATFVLAALGFVAFTLIVETFDENLNDVIAIILLAVFAIYILLIFWIQVATTIRRFHDFDYSGIAILLFLIPIVSMIYGLICLFRGGSLGDNKYGPDPLGRSLPPEPPVSQATFS